MARALERDENTRRRRNTDAEGGGGGGARLRSPAGRALRAVGHRVAVQQLHEQLGVGGQQRRTAILAADELRKAGSSMGE